MNKKIKRIVAITLSILCLFSSFAVQASAVSCESCGDAVVWAFNEETTVITISGSGSMYDYSLDNYSPWASYKSDITALIITSGVTDIGEYAFVHSTSLNTVYVPESITQINSYAFYNCTYIDTIYYASTQENWEAISIETGNDNLTDAQVVYNHFHIDEDGNGACDECSAEFYEESWSLWSFITSLFEIVKGYVVGFISLFNSTYGS